MSLSVDDAVEMVKTSKLTHDGRLMNAFKTQMLRMTSVGAVDFGLDLIEGPRLSDAIEDDAPCPKMKRATVSSVPNQTTSRQNFKEKYFSSLQDVTVVECILNHWEEAATLLTQPKAISAQKLRQYVRGFWVQTGLPTSAGPLTRKDPGASTRYRFDGLACYALVDALRTGSTKLRDFARCACNSWRHEYYESLSLEHRPRDVVEWSLLLYLSTLKKLTQPRVRDYNLRKMTTPDTAQNNATETAPRAPPLPLLDDMDKAKEFIRRRFASFKHSSNGQRTLPDAVALCLKLLTSECNVTDTNLNLVITYVFVYLTGKAPPEELLFSISSIVPKWRRLAMADEKIEADSFQEYFRRNPGARFAVYTDDTGNKTAVYVTYPHTDDEGKRIIKRMLLSVSAMLGGGDREHAEWTVALLEKFGFPLDRFCGGCTDHV